MDKTKAPARLLRKIRSSGFAPPLLFVAFVDLAQLNIFRVRSRTKALTVAESAINGPRAQLKAALKALDYSAADIESSFAAAAESNFKAPWISEVIGEVDGPARKYFGTSQIFAVSSGPNLRRGAKPQDVNVQGAPKVSRQLAYYYRRQPDYEQAQTFLAELMERVPDGPADEDSVIIDERAQRDRDALAKRQRRQRRAT